MPSSRDIFPFRRVQTIEFFRGLAQGRLEAANAEAGQDSFHLVHSSRPLSDQILSLAVRLPCILLLNSGDGHHTAMAFFSPQPPKKKRASAIPRRAAQSLPAVARHGNTCWMDHIGLDIARSQPARLPKPVAPRFIPNHNVFDRVPSLVGFGASTSKSLSSNASFASSFLRGWRSMPGPTAATSPAAGIRDVPSP
jgi:hypothetical protein